MYKFIVFEGPDGSGKSTILDMVYKLMRDEGLPVIRTREPGGTPVGEEIRDLVLGSDSYISPMTEAFLMAASRSQLVDELIIPSLECYNIITDRFVPSSLVYQGIGRGLGLERVKELNDFAIKDIRPDICLYFDAPFEACRQRMSGRGQSDNIEGQGDPFLERIHEGYRKVYKEYKDYYNMVKIDAEPETNQVFEAVMDELYRGRIL